MASVVQKVASFGNDAATITATWDDVTLVYSSVTFTVAKGTLTCSISVAGQPTVSQAATANGQLIVPNTHYLAGGADIFGSWHP